MPSSVSLSVEEGLES